jgi:hypothetical protein
VGTAALKHSAIQNLIRESGTTNLLFGLRLALSFLERVSWSCKQNA